MDCSALSGIQNIDLQTIDSNRTLRSVERILSHNITVSHIPAKNNYVADYLSHTASGTPHMPDITLQIKCKYLNCMTCMQLRRMHCPSTLVSKAAIDVRVM